jgi:Icc protein
MGNSVHLQLDYHGGTVNVLQLTDTHLGAKHDASLVGVDTAYSLQSVLDVATEAGDPDLMLLTGDLSDDGSAEAYSRLNHMLTPYSGVKAWLPGNHDDLEQMLAVAPEAMVQTIGVGPWGIILLNSQIPGEIGGALSAAELQRLVCFLRDPAYQHVLVCVHHQPLPINSQWLDEQRIANGRQLFHLLDQHKVKAVVWGHVHQEFDSWHGNVRLLATPSTCVQFAPGSEKFKVDRIGPGYRRLSLAPDGQLSTVVERIDPARFSIDYHCNGY